MIAGLTPGQWTALASSDFNIVRIVWNWGDGAVQESWLPARHTYAQLGRYTLTLQVYDDIGTNIAGQSGFIKVTNSAT